MALNLFRAETKTTRKNMIETGVSEDPSHPLNAPVESITTSYCDINDLLLLVVSTKPQAAAVSPLTPFALRDKSMSRSDRTEA